MALSDAFFAALVDLGKRHRTDPVVYLDVWNSESHLQPTAVNPSSNAQGLNEMMPRTLAGLGAPSNFAALSGESQLPWIERLIAGGEGLNGGPFATAERYYHANFFPRTMPRGQSPDTVILAENASDPEEAAGYRANAALDHGHKGAITYADISAFLAANRNGNRAVYNDARARLAAAEAQSGWTPPAAAASAPSKAPIVLGGILAAGAGAAAAIAQERGWLGRQHTYRAREAVMSREGIELGIGAAIAAIGALIIGLVASSKAQGGSPPKPPPPVLPPPVGVAWVTATQLNPGDTVRISLPVAAFDQFAQSIAGLGTGIQGWTNLLAFVGAKLTGASGATITAWAPGDALPTDWPSDDPDSATEYHAQFAYTGAQSVLVSALPLPVHAWTPRTKTGIGVPPHPPPLPPPAVAWVPVGASGVTPAGHTTYTAVGPGVRTRLSVAPAAFVSAVAANRLPQDTSGLSSLIARVWTNASVPMQGTAIVTYAPGDPLPADWPASDPNRTTGYHAEFVYGGPTTHTKPDGVTLWVAA